MIDSYTCFFYFFFFFHSLPSYMLFYATFSSVIENSRHFRKDLAFLTILYDRETYVETKKNISE